MTLFYEIDTKRILITQTVYFPSDIDECDSDPGPCTLDHQECENLPGSYACNCIDGFEKLGTGLCSGMFILIDMINVFGCLLCTHLQTF